VSLAATRELAEVLGVDQLALLQANRDRPWCVERGVLAFASVQPGDIIRHPNGLEIEIAQMGRPMMLGSSPTSILTAELQARLNAQAASVQQTIADETGVDTTNARTAQGAASAATLLQHGYDPSNSSDNANLVHAIAGGAALIPGPGPILAGAIEGLWLVGNAIACPVTDAFASIGLGTPCGSPPCKSSGNWSAAELLTTYAHALPAMPLGSFASLCVPALAMYAANAANCKGGMPPDVIIDAVVAIWNATHAGPAVGYFIPPISELGNSITPAMLVVWTQNSGTTPAGRAGMDPNAYYGFGPVQKIISDGYYESNPPADINRAQDWQPFSIAPTPPGMSASTPRIVSVNSGALLPPTKKHLDLHLGPAPAPAPAAMSTGTKVAVGGGVVLLTAGAIWLGLGQPSTLAAAGASWSHLLGKIGQSWPGSSRRDDR
jgi:hypothetical protein